jgi:hypothetical protein
MTTTETTATPKTGRRRWTPEEDAGIREMRESGKTWPEIGVALARDGKAVYQRWWNLNKVSGKPAKRTTRTRKEAGGTPALEATQLPLTFGEVSEMCAPLAMQNVQTLTQRVTMTFEVTVRVVDSAICAATVDRTDRPAAEIAPAAGAVPATGDHLRSGVGEIHGREHGPNRVAAEFEISVCGRERTAKRARGAHRGGVGNSGRTEGATDGDGSESRRRNLRGQYSGEIA